jgi:hypothetical protein
MDTATASKEFKARNSASHDATDKAAKERLAAEAQKCKERMIQAAKGGGK